ncbi:MAG: FAD-dependent oxidoreductase, partial [Gemmatimonadota bacterium]|nr:FAD-dependent oxidoreductase [Gemmatimonadota bacterium]
MSPRHLVLVGGGHAHLAVLRDLERRRWPGVRATLVSPAAAQLYSGMVPGYLRGRWDLDDLAIDLAALCRSAGAGFVEARARRIDMNGQVVETTAGPLAFDAVSLDVGSVPYGLELPGVRERAVPLRPLARCEELRRRVDGLARNGGDVRIAVVGGGAAGCEVALALHRRAGAAGARPRVRVVEREPRLLERGAEKAADRLHRILLRRGIEVRLGEAAAALEAEGVRLASGELVAAELVAWTAGAAPPPLLAASGLPLSPRGFLRVDGTLRVVGGSPAWAAGDCADLEGHDLPKAGVIAVRQGPVLARNLRAALVGGRTIPFRPRRGGYLSLLDTADGKALLRWRGLVLHGKPAGWLKRLIDRRFVR